jgi:hypothetical protein
MAAMTNVAPAFKKAEDDGGDIVAGPGSSCASSLDSSRHSPKAAAAGPR